MAIRPETDAIIEFLNSLVNIDRGAISKLLAARAGCNPALADHPSVQVGSDKDNPTRFSVGLLGILNGFCGIFDEGKKKGYGAIVAILEDDGTIRKFVRDRNTG